MSELIDLVNGEGEIIRPRVTRDDAEQYEGLHMQIVIAVITNGLGHVLVHQRAETKRVNPGDTDHVCGGILSGERQKPLHDVNLVRKRVLTPRI